MADISSAADAWNKKRWDESELQLFYMYLHVSPNFSEIRMAFLYRIFHLFYLTTYKYVWHAYGKLLRNT